MGFTLTLLLTEYRERPSTASDIPTASPTPGSPSGTGRTPGAGRRLAWRAPGRGRCFLDFPCVPGGTLPFASCGTPQPGQAHLPLMVGDSGR